MRSSRSLALAFALGLALAACGTDTGPPGGDDAPAPTPCETSHLDYRTFGEPFLLDWCTGCHAAAIPAAMRQMAPIDVNLDTLDSVRRLQDRITARATGAAATMPPAGGPSAAERALLAEWLACGAK